MGSFRAVTTPGHSTSLTGCTDAWEYEESSKLYQLLGLPWAAVFPRSKQTKIKAHLACSGLDIMDK